MSTRDRTVLLILGLAGVVAGFWLLLLSPKREESRALTAKIEATREKVSGTQAMVASGTAARNAYAGDYTAVAELGKAVPVDDDLPSLLFQLESAADRSKVDFRSIKVGSGSGGAPAAAPPAAQAAAVGAESKGGAAAGSGAAPAAGAPAAAPPAAGAAPAASGTPAAGSAAPAASGTPAAGSAAPAAPAAGAPAAGAATPATQATAAALPPGASVGAAGLTTMPFDFSFEGSFFRLQDFLGRLDRFTNVRGEDISVRGRLLTVDGFTLAAADPTLGSMTAKVRATAYLLPGDEGLLAGATPAGPAAASSSPVPAAGAAGSTPTPASAATGG